VRLENNVLTLKGERRFEKEAKEETIIVSNVNTASSAVRSLCRLLSMETKSLRNTRRVF
jgi:hypothetical protein